MRINYWGKITYAHALNKQLEAVERVIEGDEDEQIIICHHPPIVTLGKKSTPEDICGWQGETASISRGGKATYHGPGQTVAYPIINLKKRGNDIYWYLRSLEEAIVLSLKEYGIEAKGDPNSTGVWVYDRKIASIGIAIKKWITYHGLAINLFKDINAFSGIKACGMDANVMISLEEITKLREEDKKREKFEKLLANHLVSLLK